MEKDKLQETSGIEKSIFPITLLLSKFFLSKICYELDKQLPYFLSSIWQPW